MIEKRELPENFRPRYSKEFQVSETTVIVGVDYGDSNFHLEVFIYAIYEGREIVDSGVVEWDNRNGTLMLSEVAKVVICLWDPNN